MGLDNGGRPRSWGERLSGFFTSFVRPSLPDEDLFSEPRLPKIDPSSMPVSWDPQSLPEARQREVQQRGQGSGDAEPFVNDWEDAEMGGI